MYGVPRPTPRPTSDTFTLARGLRSRVVDALGREAFEELVAAGARLSPEAGIALTYEV